MWIIDQTENLVNMDAARRIYWLYSNDAVTVYAEIDHQNDVAIASFDDENVLASAKRLIREIATFYARGVTMAAVDGDGALFEWGDEDTPCTPPTSTHR